MTELKFLHAIELLIPGKIHFSDSIDVHDLNSSRFGEQGVVANLLLQVIIAPDEHDAISTSNIAGTNNLWKCKYL